MPFQEYVPDPNRLQWAPEAKALWASIRNDKPVGKRFAGDVTTAQHKAGKPGKKHGSSPSASPTAAAQNGLCG